MSKGTTIISDLRSFFSEKENNRAINAIMRVMECINIRPSQIGTEKKDNCKYTNVQVLNLLMLFPFFVVRNACRYSGSSLSRLFCCEKDMFYRFMNDGNIKWRKLLYAMNLQLIRKVSRSTEVEHDKPVCLVIDDTDAPKSGRKSELIGRIFSHVQHKSILGYKCLTLLLSDGMSQLFLDFSLHGEKGSRPDKKQGLTDKQRAERFTADYTGQGIEERIREYTMKKTDKAVEMVKYAIKRGIRFDYLLVDSWFTCADFVKLITSRHIKCHLVGMIKLGKTRYHTRWGDLAANQIVAKLQKQGLTKHSRTLRCTYCTIDVKFADTTVRLFFSKRGRKGQWNGLLTTDLSLSFLKAYRTYATRWTTEVAYYDKYIVMQSKMRSISDSQRLVRLLLTSTSHNNSQCPRSLSQSRRSLLFSHSLSESRLGTRSAYDFSRASRLAFESARA